MRAILECKEAVCLMLQVPLLLLFLLIVVCVLSVIQMVLDARKFKDEDFTDED